MIGGRVYADNKWGLCEPGHTEINSQINNFISFQGASTPECGTNYCEEVPNYPGEIIMWASLKPDEKYH